jgi:hypothetical protein
MANRKPLHSLSPGRLCRNCLQRGEAVGLPAYRQAGKALECGSLIMGNHRLYKTERLHVLGTPGSERLKVAALNLFHPTASPPFQKAVFHITTLSLVGEGRGEGE